MDTLSEILPLLIPLLILQLVLMLVALRDLVSRSRTRGPKWLWVIIIVFVNTLGPILYLVVGREEG